jgi:hypothetical protein
VRPRTMNDERGSVMVTAILLIAVMLSVGLAAMSTVDTQTEQSRRERVGESTFNLAEAALSNQIFILGRKGAGTQFRLYPEICPDSVSEFCPDNTTLLQNYDQATQVDFDPAQTEWYTWVRDNAGTGTGATPDTFWEDGLLTSRQRYDANGDKLMWVRAQATVRGRERAMVGLVRLEPRPIIFPNYAILAGKFRTSNNGNKTLVDAGTNSLGVTVRCQGSPPTVIPDNDGCIEFRPGQITPSDTIRNGYGVDETIDDEALEALLDVARANGTYYTACPSGTADGALTGAVVVLDTGTLCSFRSNAAHNSADVPGLLILMSGKLEMLGTATFHGLVYAPNRPPTSSTDPDLVKIHGNAVLTGGAIVDYDGGIEAGSSGKQNITYDANVFDISAFGTAGVVQNTWREITPIDVN